MDKLFDAAQKKLGFGLMRLPMIGEDVDTDQTKAMVDAFLARGFRYFDTAHGYINGKSELAVRECLSSRYPRDAYVLTNKLSFNYFETQEDIRPLFQQQLDACGVAYFDFYLMHALSASRISHYRDTKAFETVEALKKEGKVRHIGISFHDTAQVLDDILTEFPQIEIVQIQFNYLDFLDPKVQSRDCYEVCRKHGKPVLIMEPVKGGALASLPRSAQRVLDALEGGSPASYAVRFAAGFEGVAMVLSGMSSLEQVEDNLSYMQSFQPLSIAEQAAVTKVTQILRIQGDVPCTGCRYCTEVCPQAIAIPELFSALNAKRQEQEVQTLLPFPECLKCGKCEQICPQGLSIRELLEVAAGELR